MRRRLAWIAGLALALPLLLYAALRLGLWTPVVNLALSLQLRKHTPVQVRFGALRSDVASFIEADDVVVLAPVGQSQLPLMTISSLRLEYKGWAAWRGRVDWEEALDLARIRGLSVFLLREADGSWNLSGLGGPKKAMPSAKPARGFELPLPAGRVELEDSQVVLNDEARGFHTSIDGLQGSLDTRSLPLIAFNLNGRTEGKDREDLSVAGELDRRDGTLFSRLDLGNVPLARYLNYFLPGKGLSFGSGNASLSVRLRRDKRGELDASGRAELTDGSMRIPGIAEPLTALQGAVAFDASSLRFKQVRARFLDSTWTATGSILDLAHPRFEVSLQNPGFGLAALSEQVKGLGPLHLSGTASVDASLSGPAAHPVVEAQLSSEGLGLVGAELQAVSASARLQGLRLDVPSLRGRLWGGQMEAHATMGLGQGGKLEAVLDLQGADLEQARLYGVRPLPLSGTAGLKLRAGGQLKAPDLDLELQVQGTALGDLPLGSLDAHAAWSPQGFASQFKGANGRLAGKIAFSHGKDAAFKDASIELSGMDLTKLAHGLATAGTSLALPPSGVRTGLWLEGRLAGTVRAALTFEGPLKSPTIWIDTGLQDGRLFMGDGLLALKKPKEGLPISLRGELGFRKGDLLLGRQGKPLRLNLNRRRSGNLETLALGRFPLKRGVPGGKLNLALSGDLQVLDAFELFDDSTGRLTSDLVLGGTFDSPQATGELTVKGFSSKPSAYLAPVKSGELQVQFRGQRVDVAMLKLKAGGELTARGMIDLSGGLRGFQARLEARTDETGLRVQNWEGMGSGNLILDPLSLAVDGEAQPLRVEGRARLNNALIVYGGTPSAPQGPPSPGKAKRPLSLDLRVGLGANVWYEKRQTGGVDLLDPTQWVSGVTDSVRETFQRPDVFFRLRPTDEDIVIRSGTGRLQLLGELAIDRGRLTMMENEYQIRTDREPASIRFNGRQAEVRAMAVGRLRYTRENSLTKRPEQRAVNVIIRVKPLPLEDLERSSLADAFLNYSLSFSADPDIQDVPANQQAEAILNLVVLGDPLVDLQQAGAPNGQSGSNAVGAAQINRLLSGELRRQLSKLSKKGFKFLGTQLIDVLRVVPRFKYQAAGAAPSSGTTGQPSQDSQLVYSDLSVELGKSITEKLYGSLQLVNFGENTRDSAQAAASNGGRVKEVRPGGLRTGLEWQVAPNRTLEGYWNWSTDDNLEPVAFDPTRLEDSQSFVVRLRNTLPTENYSPALARQRRWQGTPTPPTTPAPEP